LILLRSFIIIIIDKDRSERKLSVLLLSLTKMYQTPIIAHGFNRQSFYRQPISSLRQINEVAWNRKNEIDPNAHVTIVNQQFVPEYENLENKFYSSVNGSNEVQKYLSKAVVNYHENGLSKNLPETMETGHSSTRRMCVTV